MFFFSNRKAGWGARTDRGPFPVDDQEEAEIDIVSLREPNDGYVLHAGSERGGTDTCIGMIQNHKFNSKCKIMQ